MHKDYWLDRSSKMKSAYVGDVRHTMDEHLSFYDRKKLFIYSHLPKYSKVLDYGCGVGMFSQLFDKDKYLGVDIIECAWNDFFYTNYNFKLIDEFEKIDYDPDLIICINVLQHMQEFERAIESWSIKNGFILLMENYIENNGHTFARSSDTYIDTIKRYHKVKSYIVNYFEGCNCLIKIEI